MKSREDLQELLDQLNVMIDHFDQTCDILNGGCAYVCYCLAKQFESRHVKYKTVLFVHPGTQTTDIWELAKEENICHLTLEVKGEYPTILGPDIDPDMCRQHGLTKRYINLTSDDFLKLFESYGWNQELSKSDLDDFKDEIDMIFEMVG